MEVTVCDGGVIDDGKSVHLPGNIIELDDAEADRLIRAGKVMEVALDQVGPLQIDVPMGSIVEAIGTLPVDDQELWTKSGAPKTEALEEIVNGRISAEVRDLAWASYLEHSAE